MQKIKVLIADDSAVLRRLITTVVENEPDMEVIGAAENGRRAVELARELKPDVVTLDVEMPVLDGIGALTEIRSFLPKTPIIMFSTLTTEGGKTTLEALSRGASDFVAKPSGEGGLGKSVERVRVDLTPRIRQLAAAAKEMNIASVNATAARVRATNPSAVPTSGQTPPARRTGPAQRIDCIAIAVSTGGPKALEQIVPTIPKDIGVPIFMVQHMPANFTTLLAKRLDASAQISVVEAVKPMPVEPNVLYIAPGDHHLVVERNGLQVTTALNDGPPEHSCRPAADVLFRSVAAVYGAHTLGIVLTGMGDDGSGGAAAIVSANGRIIAQDKATSVVWGMPGAVVKAGLVDAELPLLQIIPEATRRIQNSRVPRRTDRLAS